MKIFFIGYLLATLALTSYVYAEGDKDASAPVAAVGSGAEEKKIAEQRKKIEEKRTELNGSEWAVVVKPLQSKEKAKDIQDVLTFQDNQLRSKYWDSKGFSSTNYTITVPDLSADLAVWETMKTGKDGVVFIRGEWEKEAMTGSISEQLDGGKTVKEYAFTSSSKKGIPPSSDKDPGAAASQNAPSTGALVSVSTADASKKSSALVSRETDRP